MCQKKNGHPFFSSSYLKYFMFGAGLGADSLVFMYENRSCLPSVLKQTISFTKFIEIDAQFCI